jgi:protein-S-isoprenylcysteine O-methyltransferase Ste14
LSRTPTTTPNDHSFLHDRAADPSTIPLPLEPWKRGNKSGNKPLMSSLSELSIGWGYAWWFPATYALITILMVAIYGRDFAKRFLRFPVTKSIKQKIPVMLSATLFGRGLMIYSIFVPLQLNSTWFWIGISIFIIGVILSTITMINFATTPHDQPVTKGMYRISRNPIQVLAMIMWIGVGIATTSWIIVAASLLLAIVSYPSFLAQERACLEIYGDAYQKYMKSTPRYLLF